MQKQGLFYVLILAFVLVLAFAVNASSQGIPIDIPGTQVHFFTLRYDEVTPPYDQANLIWERLSTTFMDWIAAGRDPDCFGPELVTIERITNGDLAILLNGNLVVEVDEYHAEFNRASKEHLAKVWADNLRRGVVVFVENNKAL